MKNNVFNNPLLNQGRFNHQVFAKLLAGALVVLIAGCAPAQLRPDEQKAAGFMLNTRDFQITGTVEMKVHANDKRLKVQNAANDQCRFARKDDFKKGCYVVPEGYTARITFKLADQDQAGYFIRSFRICPWTAEEQEREEKPALPCALSGEVRVEFWVAEGDNILHPGPKGELTLTGKPDSFDLNNNNSIEGDYFYWVEACPNEPTPQNSCVWTDPGSRNGGKG
jgi:hypothetical protein